MSYRRRLGYTYPEATMSLGLPRVEESGSINGLDFAQLGIVQNVITRSLGDEGDVSAAGVALSVLGTVAVGALVTGAGFASYQKHGNPWRAGFVAGGITGGLVLLGFLFQRAG